MDTVIKAYLFVPAVAAVAMMVVVALLPTVMRPTGGGPKAGDLPGVALLGLIALVVHSGYLVAPWWFNTPRAVWAAAMMAPVGLSALGMIALDRGLMRSFLFLPDPRSNRSVGKCLRKAVGLLAVYVAPVGLVVV